MASDEIDTNKAIIYANKRFPGDSFKNFVASTSFHDGYTQGRSDALKELEQLQRESFASGRALISKRPYPHPLEYLHETFKDYLSSKSKEGK